VGKRSFIATTSTSLFLSCLSLALKNCLPILPKPLIPTFIAIFPPLLNNLPIKVFITSIPYKI
jgi:hypothetical protein